MELSITNEHPRDKEIVFDEEPHIYYIKGSNDNISVTTFVHSNLFPHFDADKVISKMMKSRNWEKSKYYGKTPDEIKDEWEKNRVESSEAGTGMHKSIELFYNNEIVNKYKKNKNMKELINFDNIEKDIEEQKDFLRAEYKSSIKVGDILIFKGDTFHKGSKNLSEETRYFLHLRYQLIQ